MAELKFAAHLHYASSTSPKDIDWEIPVLALEAQNDVGVAELLVEIRRHRAILESGGALAARRRRRLRAEVEALVVDEFRARLAAGLHADALARVLDDVAFGRIYPYSAAAALLPMLSLDRS